MSFDKKESNYILYTAKKLRAVRYLGGKCTQCHTCDHAVLQFHHLEQSEKEEQISRLYLGRWSNVQKELEKCSILCANCHSEHHYSNGRNGQKSTNFLLNRGLTNCQICKYQGDNVASLDFHHISHKNKSFGISRVIHRVVSVSASELEEELKKCQLICKNCHAQKHYDYEKFNRLKPLIEKKMESYKELRPKIDRDMVLQKMLNGSRQTDIVKELGCSKGTISDIVKGLRKEGKL
jgi:hypothetical protein